MEKMESFLDTLVHFHSLKLIPKEEMNDIQKIRSIDVLENWIRKYYPDLELRKEVFIIEKDLTQSLMDCVDDIKHFSPNRIKDLLELFYDYRYRLLNCLCILKGTELFFPKGVNRFFLKKLSEVSYNMILGIINQQLKDKVDPLVRKFHGNNKKAIERFLRYKIYGQDFKGQITGSIDLFPLFQFLYLKEKEIGSLMKHVRRLKFG